MRALVTGGASGIGMAIATMLADRGCDVIIADVDIATGQSVANQAGGTFLKVDVSSRDDWAAVPEVDVAVFNAGVVSGPVNVTTDLWRDPLWTRIRDVNVDGLVLGFHAILPSMVIRGSGSVVVTASQSGLAPHAFDPLYGASKHFAIGLARSTAAQVKDSGVRINILCPGATDTAIIIPEMRDERLGVVFQPPERVAEVGVNLLLDRTGTGEAWIVPPNADPQLWHFHDVPDEYRRVATTPVEWSAME